MVQKFLHLDDPQLLSAGEVQMSKDDAPLQLSVIIVNWNTRELTLNCLRSIIGQMCEYPFEIIVVDNASSDGSVSAIKGEFPGVKVIANEQNLGFAKANNLGLRECRGRYVLLINSDVILREDCIVRLYEHMEKHPQIGVIGPRILNGDLTLQESCKEFPTLWNTLCRALALDTAFPGCRLFSSQLMRYWSHNDVRPVDILSGCFWMTRRDAVEAVGELDERFFMYAEDKDWCKRFWKQGWAVVYFPDAEAIHFGESSSARDPLRFSVEMTRANLRYWKKHYGIAQRVTVRGIMLLHQALRLFGEAVMWILRPSTRQSAALKLKRSVAITRALLFERTPA